jgi:hypothetical protein
VPSFRRRRYVGAGSQESDSFAAKLFLREQAVDKQSAKKCGKSQITAV